MLCKCSLYFNCEQINITPFLFFVLFYFYIRSTPILPKLAVSLLKKVYLLCLFYLFSSPVFTLTFNFFTIFILLSFRTAYTFTDLIVFAYFLYSVPVRILKYFLFLFDSFYESFVCDVT